MKIEPDVREVLELEERICRILANHLREIQGCVLASLAARWISGHIDTAGAEPTRRARALVMMHHLNAIIDLVRANGEDEAEKRETLQ